MAAEMLKVDDICARFELLEADQELIERVTGKDLPEEKPTREQEPRCTGPVVPKERFPR